MPRQNRIHYRHAFYHVMLRGNNRQNIFYSDEDFSDFLACLNKVVDSYGSSIHLYCLMTNHVHTVIEVADIPISKIMQSVNTKYAKKHNKKHGKIGHLFQGRFQSKLIHDDQYLLELCYYIHMNPMKAQICKTLDDYPMSSHHAYSNQGSKSTFTKFVTTSHIHKLFSRLNISYHDFMLLYKSENITTQYCSFDEKGNLIINDSISLKKQENSSVSLENITLDTIAKVTCDYLDVDIKALSSDSFARKITLARAMTAYFAHYRAKYTLGEVANDFGLVADSLSRTLHRYIKRSRDEVDIRNTLDAIESKLSEISMSDTDILKN